MFLQNNCFYITTFKKTGNITILCYRRRLLQKKGTVMSIYDYVQRRRIVCQLVYPITCKITSPQIFFFFFVLYVSINEQQLHYIFLVTEWSDQKVYLLVWAFDGLFLSVESPQGVWRVCWHNPENRHNK